MFQSFNVTSRPDQGPPRLNALRQEMQTQGLAGYVVPRADAHQGEYVAPRDERLAWLTGFTGSAGFCVVLQNIAAVFVDGRYRTQVKTQVADLYTPVDWPEVSLTDWLQTHLPDGGKVGFDPWLHTVDQITKAQTALANSGIELTLSANLVDRIWADQPGPPLAPARAYPLDLSGESHEDKRARLAQELQQAGQETALITLPDSLCWLLNIRGSDIPRNPVAQGFALLHKDGTVDLFMAPEKLTDLATHLGKEVRVHAPDRLLESLQTLKGPVRIDPQITPVALADALTQAGVETVHGDDPCLLPKARKNAAELAGTTEAHLRDGAAMVEFLAWLDAQPLQKLTEIDVVKKLEHTRRNTNALLDISFETIAGAGPNGAIMHYHVTEETNRPLEPGTFLVLDSGGQYLDGTTDITRTIALGAPPEEARACFTRVLAGMIDMSRLRWPEGLAGRDIEAVGRAPLWRAGQDFNHGLGHGVGVYLNVHEGPQRLSRSSHVPLEPGMILSNEPGYYREGAFGIRLENLVVVEQAPDMPSGDSHRNMLCWRTLTYVPIDRRAILPELLDQPARDWLNAYHAEVAQKIGPRVGAAAKSWLDAATAPI